MRQRKIKNLDEKLEALSSYTVDDAADLKGKWRSLAAGKKDGADCDEGSSVKLFAEFGCGKGKFIRDMALAHPENMYAAFEGNLSVVYHAMQKADEEGLDNVWFVPHYIDTAADYFDDGELDGIYLNFSDPWPKSKHEKRRLTAGTRMEEYVRAVKPGGSIQFRTDNDDLFEYTLDKLMMLSGIKIVAVTRDLHAEIRETAGRIDLNELTEAGFEDGIDESLTTLDDLQITTEYEDKFSATGKNINYVYVKII